MVTVNVFFFVAVYNSNTALMEAFLQKDLPAMSYFATLIMGRR